MRCRAAAHAEPQPHCDTDGDAEPDAHGDPVTDADRYAEPDSDALAESVANGNTATVADADTLSGVPDATASRRAVLDRKEHRGRVEQGPGAVPVSLDATPSFGFSGAAELHIRMVEGKLQLAGDIGNKAACLVLLKLAEEYLREAWSKGPQIVQPARVMPVGLTPNGGKEIRP